MFRIRRVLAASTLLAPLAVTLVTVLLWWDRLPRTIPTQWHGGEVTGSQPTGVFVATQVAITAVAGGIGVAVLLLADRPARLIVATGLVGGVAAGSWIAVAGAALGHQAGVTASGVVGIAVGIVWGVPAAILAPARREPTTSCSRFSELGVNPFGAGVGVLLGVGAVLLDLGVVSRIGLGAVAVLALLTAIIRIAVDERSVRVLFGAVIPVRLVARDRVRHAAEHDASPFRGLGVRLGHGGVGVLLPFGRDIRILRDDGRRVDVTVRDPAAFLAALQTS